MWRLMGKSIPTCRPPFRSPMWTMGFRLSAEHERSHRACALVRQRCEASQNPRQWLARFARGPGEAFGPTCSIVVRLGSFAENFVLRRWQWLISLAITPQNRIQHRRVRRIRVGEIHLGRLLRTLSLRRIHLIDHTVLAIAPVGSKW